VKKHFFDPRNVAAEDLELHNPLSQVSFAFCLFLNQLRFILSTK
jgi:hypothetical protein